MVWLLTFLMVINGYKFNRIALLPNGSYLEPVLIWDTDHNGLDELIFSPGWLHTGLDMVIWEYKEEYRFELVYTHAFNSSESGTTFIWSDIGDGDKDGLAEIICGIAFREGEEVKSGGAIMERVRTSIPIPLRWSGSIP